MRPKNHRPTGDRTVQTIVVRRAARLPGEERSMGHVKAGQLTLACSLGRAGTTQAKREGDGATPVGPMRLLHGFYRPDRMSRPFCRVPLRPLPPGLGWCDDPCSPAYNRAVPLPLRAGHEDMWRDDGLYDIVFVLDYNIQPRRAGRGSAIFLHCAKYGGASRRFKPTLGCIALRPADMRRLLGRIGRNTRLVVR